VYDNLEGEDVFVGTKIQIAAKIRQLNEEKGINIADDE
jgi:hypothetical protein